MLKLRRNIFTRPVTIAFYPPELKIKGAPAVVGNMQKLIRVMKNSKQ